MLAEPYEKRSRPLYYPPGRNAQLSSPVAGHRDGDSREAGALNHVGVLYGFYKN